MPSADDLSINILNGVPQPVWVVGAAGNIVFANPASVATLGYDSAVELVGRSSHGTVHFKRPDGSPYPEQDCPMLRPRITGQTVHGEDEWFARRDGSMFPIAWWSAPIALPDGLGAVFAFTDITERRLAERVVRERDAAEVRTAQARAAQRRIVQDQAVVRQQVARDLHDGAQQRLVTVLIGLQFAREEVLGTSEQAVALLDQATEQTHAAIAELRELAAGLHPAILSSRGLYAAVEALAARAALPVTVAGSVQRPLPSVVASHAYYLVAETLTNAVKHARASHVVVTIEAVGPTLLIEVSDDGVGGAEPTGPNDPNGASDPSGTGDPSGRGDRSGSGLIGLADRLAALDGTFAVRSRPGEGTTVRAEFPLSDEDPLRNEDPLSGADRSAPRPPGDAGQPRIAADPTS